MYEHVGGFIECCSCLFTEIEENWFPTFKTPREALKHLDLHKSCKHDIGHARKRILETYPDLDIMIEPYKSEHPPKGFRDRSNGE
jgi:hypothetical protein